MSTKQAAAVLGVSVRTIHREIQRGRLRAIRVGGLVKVPESALTSLGLTEEDILRGVYRFAAAPDGVRHRSAYRLGKPE